MNTTDANKTEIYAAYCRGRIGGTPDHCYSVAEYAAAMLGREAAGGPIPSLDEVAQRVADLLTPPPAAPPPAQAAAPADAAEPAGGAA